MSTAPDTSTATPSGPDATIRGECWVIFAFDVGRAIDLDRAQALFAPGSGETAHRESIKHPRQAPAYFELRPAPLTVDRKADSVAVSAWRTSPAVEFTLYDFGAVSVLYQIELAGPLGSLATLSECLYENRSLLEDARRKVEDLVRELGTCVTRPNVLNIVEDYVVYRLGLEGELPFTDSGAALISRHSQTLARVLRAECGPLSQQEVNDAILCRISYRPTDLCLIDWNASILILDEAHDVRTALEFANVELLELRFLDDQLDRALDASGIAAAEKGGFAKLGARQERAELRRVAELQTEASLLFENVNNAIKLIGDQYLARVYRLAGERLHLPDWDATIIRKLETLESLYEKLADRGTSRRMEVLEWIIIVLIAVSTVLSLLPGLTH